MTVSFSTLRTGLLIIPRMTRINPRIAPPSFAKGLTTMNTPTGAPRDPNTVSNYNYWKTKHTIADLVIDFKKQRLHGTVSLFLVWALQILRSYFTPCKWDHHLIWHTYQGDFGIGISYWEGFGRNHPWYQFRWRAENNYQWHQNLFLGSKRQIRTLWIPSGHLDSGWSG